MVCSAISTARSRDNNEVSSLACLSQPEMAARRTATPITILRFTFYLTPSITRVRFACKRLLGFLSVIDAARYGMSLSKVHAPDRAIGIGENHGVGLIIERSVVRLQPVELKILRSCLPHIELAVLPQKYQRVFR